MLRFILTLLGALVLASRVNAPDWRPGVRRAELLPDGSVIAAWQDGTITRSDISGGNRTTIMEWPALGPVESIEMRTAGGGRRLFVWRLNEPGKPVPLKLRNPNIAGAADGEGKAVASAAERAAIRLAAVALSPDGTQAAIGDMAGNVTLFSVASGAEVRSFEVHKGSVWSIAFSRDGTRLLTAGGDGQVRVTMATNGNVVSTIGE